MDNKYTLTPQHLTTDVVARYEAKVARVSDPSACDEFVGTRTNKRYGQLSMRIEGKRRMVGAHRIAYVLATGDSLTPQDIVDHLCHNPSCQKPTHLRKTVKRGNAVTMVASGRWRGGPRGRAFSAQEVVVLRRRWAEGDSIGALAVGTGVNVTTMTKLVRGDSYKDVPMLAMPHRNGRARGERNAAARLTHGQVALIKARLLLGHSRTQIAADYGVSDSTVGGIARGRTWSHVESAPIDEIREAIRYVAARDEAS